MSTAAADFNAKVIEEFRANEGRVGGMFEGMPLLLLHHTGAKSGKSRVSPLDCQDDDAGTSCSPRRVGPRATPAGITTSRPSPTSPSKSGRRRSPWSPARRPAKNASASIERTSERVPQFAKYQAKAGRAIPVIVLTPAKTG